ncbi:hypothetical protein [Maledivibacter halophilus]|uniref:Uncharacterized protein n=1 Tax=Maledivibacter halophilus TaxID=36842 RepID=A0A1T5KEP9_9FIRM|nr:hypothetical protein [Maledivibacter halophilus]SKC61828.1 hypothetical protein SAMN02194393_01716 [Maledivibacter halophilus]
MQTKPDKQTYNPIELSKEAKIKRYYIKKFESITEAKAEKLVDEIFELMKESKITYGDAYVVLENTRAKIQKMSEFQYL